MSAVHVGQGLLPRWGTGQGLKRVLAGSRRRWCIPQGGRIVPVHPELQADVPEDAKLVSPATGIRPVGAGGGSNPYTSQ